MAVVESRLATVTEESKQAWSKLIELESTSSALKGEVRGLLVVVESLFVGDLEKTLKPLVKFDGGITPYVQYDRRGECGSIHLP